MINRMYKFRSGISQEEKSRKIREIKEIMKQYPELNQNTQAYFDDEGTYVINVFEPTFMDKLRVSLKKQNKKMIQDEHLYNNYQEGKNQSRYNSYR